MNKILKREKKLFHPSNQIFHFKKFCDFWYFQSITMTNVLQQNKYNSNRSLLGAYTIGSRTVELSM